MYLKDLRRSVLSYLKQGNSICHSASVFDISPNTLQSWKKETASNPSRAGRPVKVNQEALLKDVELYHDAYQAERAIQFNLIVLEVI